MSSSLNLFLAALAERESRKWTQSLNLGTTFKACTPVKRTGVEVMLGLPRYATWQVLDLGETKGLVILDNALLFGAVDKMLGGTGEPPHDTAREATLLEESLARKLSKEILEPLGRIWDPLFDVPQIKLSENDTGQSPWHAGQWIVETALEGGWSNCQGVLRLLWPEDWFARAFGELNLKEAKQHDWDILPWTPPAPVPQAAAPVTPTSPPERNLTPIAQNAPVPSAETEKENQKRIAFDDFDAIIENLGKDPNRP